jgi:alanine-alpha-ketoisovalerate/valine-pyruvate aminotransferase
MEELTPEQKLKGTLIFKYLKTGKIPKRKGLFRILFYLAGQHKHFRGINMTSSSVTNKRPNIDRTIQIGIYRYKLDFSRIHEVFKKYLLDYEFRYEEDSFYLTVYYSSNLIQWALIDEELRTNHAENITEHSGFPRIVDYQYEKK